MLFFWCAEQKKLSAQYKLLPLYGAIFAALLPSSNKQSAVQKSVAFSRGGGGCVEVLGQHAAVENL